MTYGLHVVILTDLPFFNDDDDCAQQEDEDDQSSGADPKNQTHVFRVLGDAQRFTVVFAGR